MGNGVTKRPVSLWQLATHAGQPLQVISAPAQLFHTTNLPASVPLRFFPSPLEGVSITASLLLPPWCFHFILSIASSISDPLPPSSSFGDPSRIGNFKLQLWRQQWAGSMLGHWRGRIISQERSPLSNEFRTHLPLTSALTSEIYLPFIFPFGAGNFWLNLHC